MLNPTINKFKFKRPTFGVKNPSNQSNLDGFVTKGNETSTSSKSDETQRPILSRDEQVDSREPVTVDKIHSKFIEKSSHQNFSKNKTVNTSSTCSSITKTQGALKNAENTDLDDLLDRVEINSYSTRIDDAKDCEIEDDTFCFSMDYACTYETDKKFLEKATRPNKDTEFDINFDYDDWSRTKSEKKTSSRSYAKNVVNGYSFSENASGITKENKTDVDFGTSFNFEDDGDDVDQNYLDTSVKLIEATPEKRCPSPPLFERSPVIGVSKLPSKKFKPKTPVAARLLASESMTYLSTDLSSVCGLSTIGVETARRSDDRRARSTTPESDLVHGKQTAHLAPSNFDSKVSDNARSSHDNEQLPSVKSWLNEAQAKCFGSVARNNAIYDLESNLTILRNYEKKINDAVFEWFTSIPDFVAEQLTYVSDPTDLIKLRVFRNRLREKLAEFERRSMEAFAENNPVENEEFSRVSRQMKTLSKIVQNVKKHISPEKRVSSRRASNNLAKASAVAFYDSDGDDEETLQSDNDEDLMASSSNTSAAGRRFTRFDDESLPSTQETNKLYADWNQRSEKRKRSPSEGRQLRSPEAPYNMSFGSETSHAASTTNQPMMAATAASKFKFKTSSLNRKVDDTDANTSLALEYRGFDSKASFSEMDESVIADFIDSEVIREFENDDDLLFKKAGLATATSSTMTNSLSGGNASFTTAMKGAPMTKKKKLMYASNSDDELTVERATAEIPSVLTSSSETGSQENLVGSVYGKFSGDFPNDGISGEFSRSDFRHFAELNKVFRTRFGLHKFRPNQMEAINAAMLGHDCFILMPTGGGKSLCYQLPAILTSGVTIVISPLKSLIIDQTEKLKALDIPAAHLLGETTVSEMNMIYTDLSKKEPPLKLLYVTPEKIAISPQLRSAFTNLYQRQLLARFVIDEAHCVSQWGHDFRPDYKRLSSLRENYPSVPMMALTATATPRVRNDILHQLNIKSPKWFISSFNRPNLKYEVVPKKSPKPALLEIIDLIKRKFSCMAGILYCLTRKDCDSCADQLNLHNIRAMSYHAGLSDKNRNTVQSQWISNKIHVVCATIAFGMGIDKPDVRFVIHYSLPKSIEGYYQESGRAGRDGKLSWCILYYSFNDCHRILKLIDFGDGTLESKDVHKCNLWRMVRFCENKIECRRSLQLNYFGEYFKREICIAGGASTCDNCSQLGAYKNHDVTEDCKAIVRFVEECCGDASSTSWDKNFTSTYIGDVFYGSNAAKVREKHGKHPTHGRGSKWSRVDIDRLLHQLILQGYLVEKMTAMRDDIVNAYVKLGPRARELLSGNVKIMFPMMESSGVKANVRATRKSALDIKLKKNNNLELETIQEQCYQELVIIRDSLATEFGIKANSIVSLECLKAMSEKLPTNAEEMLAIDGVSEAIFRKFGKFMLDVTSEFAEKKKTLRSVEEVGDDDDSTRLLWEDEEMASPYFQSSCSTSGGSQRKKLTAKKPAKRRFRRKKKTSPTKRKYKATTKKSPKKSSVPNRALSTSKLGLLIPKQYAHMRPKSS